MEIKQQSNEKGTTNTRKTKTKHQKKKKKKLINILRQNGYSMVTVNTVKKSWKNTMLAKYTSNYWLTYDRSGKHATNFKCLL